MSCPKDFMATLPADFDPILYLLANPDVARAGMDAREHYLKYGHKENRSLRPQLKADPYSTHQSLLVAAMLRTQGSILEMGGGWYSTPLVSAFANTQRRTAFTIETCDWVYQLLKPLSSRFHNVCRIDGFDFDANGGFVPRTDTTPAQYAEIQSRFLTELCGRHPLWSVVFVDQAPGYLRVAAIEYFANIAEFIVVHDTDNVARFESCLSKFRYRWDFRMHTPNAAIVSNLTPCDDFGFLDPAAGASGEPRGPDKTA